MLNILFQFLILRYIVYLRHNTNYLSQCTKSSRLFLLSFLLHKYLLDFRREYSYDFSIHAVSNRFELDMDSDLYKNSFERIRELISYLDQKGDLDFRLGAGMGSSLGDSHYQADMALQEAIRYGKNDGFIIHGEDSALTGPLSLTRTLNYSYSNTKALQYAQMSGINESNLLKIVGLFQMDEETVMTAASLSQWLNITTRSCSRILQQLLDSGLIAEIESLKPAGKGRPTRQYRFIRSRFLQVFF